jgi:hypothetical protein
VNGARRTSRLAGIRLFLVSNGAAGAVAAVRAVDPTEANDTSQVGSRRALGLNVRGVFSHGQELLTGPRKRHRSLDEPGLFGQIGDPHVAAPTVNFVSVGDRGFDRLAAGKSQQSEAYEQGRSPQHVARIVPVPRSTLRLWSRFGVWGNPETPRLRRVADRLRGGQGSASGAGWDV